MAKVNLTQGSISRILLEFSIPYLIACFLQTFYGLADLFVVGQFNGAASISAVTIGSQVTHVLTVVIVGLSMGSTVMISRSIGADNDRDAARAVGNAVTLFTIVAAVLTAVLLLTRHGILVGLSTPVESMDEALAYITVCFIGTPFIIAYNVISSIFRGIGDTRSPMIFVGIAGVINVIGDYILVGPLQMGAAGAAIATVASQAFSVIIALIALLRAGLGMPVHLSDFVPEIRSGGKGMMQRILQIGTPIAMQEGICQVSFLIITIIANGRGVNIAAAVGIVEKFVSFPFLVPSAMQASVSAVVSQNVGAGLHERARKTLWYGIAICAGFGLFMCILCQIFAVQILTLFAPGEALVISLGAQYLRAYAPDCVAAGIHFCCSGYFSAYGKAKFSFLHNMISVFVFRVPGAYLASILFPDTLVPMGLAVPIGSTASVIICMLILRHYKGRWETFV